MHATSTDAIDLLERLDAAMEAGKGGEYRAMNLAKELRKAGLELRVIEAPPVVPRFNMDTAE